MDNKVIKIEHVGMRFNLMEKKVDNLKEYFIKLMKHELRYQEFWALKDVSFSVNKGDRVGILGLNGAGKSTLLKVIAGVLKATEGKVSIKGKIVPLLELGAGFDPQYTGAENIYLYGAMLGYPKEFIKDKYDEIVEFSELEDFINVPVKNYSSGMKARLGFSIATIVEPEILILDEVLSVGDARFRKKSEAKVKGMFDDGVTVLFVSHSIDQVKRMCNKAILLEHGQLIAEGDVKDVSFIYEQKVTGLDAETLRKKKRKAKKDKEKKAKAKREKAERMLAEKEQAEKSLIENEFVEKPLADNELFEKEQANTSPINNESSEKEQIEKLPVDKELPETEVNTEERSGINSPISETTIQDLMKPAAVETNVKDADIKTPITENTESENIG